jgi:hypothetical protein
MYSAAVIHHAFLALSVRLTLAGLPVLARGIADVVRILKKGSAMEREM